MFVLYCLLFLFAIIVPESEVVYGGGRDCVFSQATSPVLRKMSHLLTASPGSQRSRLTGLLYSPEIFRAPGYIIFQLLSPFPGC